MSYNLSDTASDLINYHILKWLFNEFLLIARLSGLLLIFSSWWVQQVNNRLVCYSHPFSSVMLSSSIYRRMRWWFNRRLITLSLFRDVVLSSFFRIRDASMRISDKLAFSRETSQGLARIEVTMNIHVRYISVTFWRFFLFLIILRSTDLIFSHFDNAFQAVEYCK